MIDDYFTVQACLDADPDSVHPSDFQIKQTRSFVDPEKLFQNRGDCPKFCGVGGAKLGLSPSPSGFETSDTSPLAALPITATQPLDRLIDALASRNAPPQLIDQAARRVPRFAADYDWREQRRVRAALSAVLHTQSDALWWRLREHFTDQRYVLTASRNERARNFTVGEFCRDFFAADLASAYARHLPAVVGRLPPAFHPDDLFWQNEHDWSRAQKPLHEIQIAVCQQAIQQWSAVNGTVAGDDGEAHTYTSAEKARFIAAVTKQIQALRQTRRAVFFDAIVPGLAAPSGWEGFDEPSEPQDRSDAGPRQGLSLFQVAGVGTK